MSKTIHSTIPADTHSKLIVIQKHYGLNNLNDAIAKAIELAYENLPKKKEA